MRRAILDSITHSFNQTTAFSDFSGLFDLADEPKPARAAMQEVVAHRQCP